MKAGWKNRIEERRYFEQRREEQRKRANENIWRRVQQEMLSIEVENARLYTAEGRRIL